MRIHLMALLVALCGTASAGTPIDVYLETKARAVDSLKHPAGMLRPKSDEKFQKDAVLVLEKLLKDVIEPINVSGFPSTGASNIVSLSDGEMESGAVDGIRMKSSDGTTLLVTTLPLIEAWLEVNGSLVTGQPQTMQPHSDQALQSSEFYTQVLQTDAAVNIYASIPANPKTANTSAHAFLIRMAQDNVSPLPPDRLLVSVVRGPRVYILNRPFKRKLADIPECEKAWTVENDRIQLMFPSARQAPDFTSAIEKAQAEEGRADLEFKKCYGEQANKQAFFPSLVMQAQELMDRVN